jgi:hypothetical protein
MPLLYLLCFLLNKIREQRVEQVLPGSIGREGKGGRGKIAQTMYTHVNKCKNENIKEGKNRTKILVGISMVVSWTNKGRGLKGKHNPIFPPPHTTYDFLLDSFFLLVSS